MKIVSITIVKNEVDIIESFIRYHLNIVDEIIILDNCSSDETPLIINKLIDEGLPIIFLADSNKDFTQSFKTNMLLNKAFNEHGADIVCVLDSDEFLISTNNINPRDILKNLDLSEYYLVKWNTYVPTENDSYDFFIPKRITHVRDENLESFYKVIVTKEVYNNFSPKLEMGNYDLIFPNGETPQKNMDFNLRIAHFPIRSREQCMSKIIVAWPNLISINTEHNPWGFHLKKIFDKIKTNQYLIKEDLKDFAKYYALENFDDDVKIVNRPINLDFCQDINIKYYGNINYLRNVLDNVEESAKQLVSFKRLLNKNNLSRFNHDYNIIKNSQLFDSQWYLKNYALENDVNPIAHFLITWRENMNDPARFFSTEFYLKTHKDVANTGMNPFVHYISYGKKENRKIAPSQHIDVKISIIIPVYNVEEYLNECMDSVINQTYSNLEIICINDGSTDNSLNILEYYAQKDNRITIINQKNQGLGFARNVGLKYATGDYIFFIDSDDSILENTLELLLENAFSNNSDVVIYKLIQFNHISGECSPFHSPLENLFCNVDFSRFTFNYKDIKEYFLRITPTAWSKFYKKEFLDKYDLIFPINSYYEDVLFHVKVLLRASKISFLPEELYKNRISNPNSIMKDFSKSIDILKVCDDVEEFLHNNNYFDEVELEFYIFKIDQLRYHFSRLKTDEFKLLIKKEFEKMDLSNKEKDIPKNYLNFYNIILES